MFESLLSLHPLFGEQEKRIKDLEKLCSLQQQEIEIDNQIILLLKRTIKLHELGSEGVENG